MNYTEPFLRKVEMGKEEKEDEQQHPQSGVSAAVTDENSTCIKNPYYQKKNLLVCEMIRYYKNLTKTLNLCTVLEVYLKFLLKIQS